MNKKVLKTISILVLAVLAIFLFAMPTFAANDYLNPDYIKPADSSGASRSIQNIAGAILAMVQIVAISVAVIMLIVLAIKYISAAPNDKAEIKKHAVVYIVGAVILFSASGILQIIKNFAGNIDPSTDKNIDTTV